MMVDGIAEQARAGRWAGATGEASSEVQPLGGSEPTE